MKNDKNKCICGATEWIKLARKDEREKTIKELKSSISELKEEVNSLVSTAKIICRIKGINLSELEIKEGKQK